MNSKEHLQGQWLGRIDGDVKGLCVMDIDHEDGKLFGKACLYPDDPELPSTMAVIVNLEAKREQSLVCDILPIDPYGRPLTSLELKKFILALTMTLKPKSNLRMTMENSR